MHYDINFAKYWPTIIDVYMYHWMDENCMEKFGCTHTLNALNSSKFVRTKKVTGDINVQSKNFYNNLLLNF